MPSRLSENFEIVLPASQTSTPFSASPIASSLPLPTNPTNLTAQPQSYTETESMAAEIVTSFHGNKDDENPEDFLRAFYRRMGDKNNRRSESRPL